MPVANDKLSRTSGPLPAVPLLLAIACTALAVASDLHPPLHDLLDYQRDAIAHGEFHRLLTAHLVHLSATHAVLDIAGLLLVAWIFAAELRAGQQVIVCLLAVGSIDASLWVLHPEVLRYAGLSGVLHGWFAAGCVSWALASEPWARHGPRSATQVRKRTWGIALSVGLAIKLILESRQHAFWLGATPLDIVTSAHRWGAAAGALYALATAMLRRRRPPASASAASSVR